MSRFDTIDADPRRQSGQLAATRSIAGSRPRARVGRCPSPPLSALSSLQKFAGIDRGQGHAPAPPHTALSARRGGHGRRANL